MQTWEFEALDKSGAKVRGRIRAESEFAALIAVKDKSLHPLSVTEKKVESGLFNRISNSELEQLVMELSLLLRNGVQLDRAFEMMSDSNANSTAAAMLAEITESVRGGDALHVAFAKYPRYFNNLFCQMVRIGEESGKLAITLERLGKNLKFQNELQGKVNQAMIYPGFIFMVCIMALFAIFNFIVPSMEGLFQNMKHVPSYTQFLIDTSAWMRKNQFFLGAFIGAFGLFVLVSYRKPWFKNAALGVMRKLPLLRTGLLFSERIRYISAMHLMLQSGLPLAQALTFSVPVVTDVKLQKQLTRVKDQVSQGGMLSEGLASTDILEPVMLSLIRVGEESGNLEGVFGEITERSRWRFEQWAIKLTSMLEPILILVMGGMVGSVVVTMLLSIVSTSDVPL